MYMYVCIYPGRVRPINIQDLWYETRLCCGSCVLCFDSGFLVQRGVGVRLAAATPVNNCHGLWEFLEWPSTLA